MSVIWDLLIDFIWPKFCVICDKEGTFLCQKCKKHLPSALQVCPMCTKPNIYGLTHENCSEKNGLGGLLAIFDYKDKGVRKVIETIKFGFNRELIDIMLAGWKKPSGVKGVIFVPIPLHRYRENWRGFNQAELIARRLVGDKNEILSALKRIRATRQQSKLKNRRERQLNLKDSFVLREGFEEKVKGKRIILVDDIYTTGATMKECTGVLKTAGVEEVSGLVLAR